MIGFNTRMCPYARPLPALLAAGVLTLFATGVTAQDTTTPPVTAAEASLPKGEELLERCITAMGGEARYNDMKSSHYHVTVDAGDFGGGELHVYWAKGDKQRLRLIDNESAEEMVIVVNGPWAWSQDPTGGYELDTADAVSDLLVFTAFTRIVPSLHSDVKSEKATIKTVAELEFDGRTCYKAQVSHADGGTQHVLFESDSGLPAGLELVQESPFGDMTVALKFRDIEEVNGLKHISRVVMEQMGMELTLRAVKVEYDNVDMTMFDPPAEVEKMIEERKAAENTDKKDDGGGQ